MDAGPPVATDKFNLHRQNPRRIVPVIVIFQEAEKYPKSLSCVSAIRDQKGVMDLFLWQIHQPPREDLLREKVESI